MAAKELPKIRAGMGDVESPAVEAWSDDDYRRATGPAGRSCRPTARPIARACRRWRPRRCASATGRCCASARSTSGVRARADGERGRRVAGDARLRGGNRRRGRRAGGRTTWWFPVGARRARRCGAATPSRRWRRARPMPRALGVLPGSPHGATQLPHATGIAWAMKMQASEEGAARRGQGGARLPGSRGDQRRGLSRRAELRGRVPACPAVFVCINGAPAGAASVETVSETIAVKALAYGIAGVRVDGNDLFAVYAATRAAVGARPRGRRRDADRGGAGGDGRSARPACGSGSRARRFSMPRPRAPCAARSRPRPTRRSPRSRPVGYFRGMCAPRRAETGGPRDRGRDSFATEW